jgi:hypothetical protein
MDVVGSRTDGQSMLLAPLLFAATLGQACPEPTSRYGPPPCAAANVPGCLPGYRRQVDEYGRAIYVCDRDYRAPAPAPTERIPAPSPDRYGQSAPAPAFVAPRQPERRGHVGLVLMPGVTTIDRAHTADAVGALGLEFRGSPGPVGGARLRLGFEYARLGSFVGVRRYGRVFDASLKYDFNDRGMIRPFLTLGAGAASIDQDPGWRATGSVSSGLDLYPARDFFVTLEVKHRLFTHDAGSRGLQISSLHQTSVFAGIGIYL